MEDALSTLLRGIIPLVGAGRTDTGVHAKQMVAHFDFGGKMQQAELVHRLNAYLPEDISIHGIRKVHADAHARFDAVQRTYEYWIVQKKDPFFKDSAHRVLPSLSISAMNKAAKILQEYNDFESFSKAHSDVKTFICKIQKAQWEQQQDKLVFTIIADRFLRNMVRAVVGTLLEVGLGKKEPHEIRQVIESKDRGKAGVSVPAKGLYLTEVIYPDSIFI